MFYYCDYNSYFFNKFLKKERYVDVWKRVTLTMLHLSPARLWSPDGLWHRCFHLFTRHKVLYILFFITSIVRICYVYIKLAWVEWLRAASVIAWGRRASKYKLSETRIHLTDDAAIWSISSSIMPILLCLIKLISCIYGSNISLISVVTYLFYCSSWLEGMRVWKEYLVQKLYS